MISLKPTACSDGYPRPKDTPQAPCSRLSFNKNKHFSNSSLFKGLNSSPAILVLIVFQPTRVARLTPIPLFSKRQRNSFK